VYWREVTGEVSPALAQKFRQQVYGTQRVSIIGGWTAIGVGLALILVSVVLLVWNERRTKLDRSQTGESLFTQNSQDGYH
jgi:hypothetical protein